MAAGAGEAGGLDAELSKGSNRIVERFRLLLDRHVVEVIVLPALHDEFMAVGGGLAGEIGEQRHGVAVGVAACLDVVTLPHVEQPLHAAGLGEGVLVDPAHAAAVFRIGRHALGSDLVVFVGAEPLLPGLPRHVEHDGDVRPVRPRELAFVHVDVLHTSRVLSLLADGAPVSRLTRTSTSAGMLAASASRTASRRSARSSTRVPCAPKARATAAKSTSR